LEGIPPTPAKLHIESVLLALLLSLPVKSTPFAATDWMVGFLHEWIADRSMDGWARECGWGRLGGLTGRGRVSFVVGAAVVGLAK